MPPQTGTVERTMHSQITTHRRAETTIREANSPLGASILWRAWEAHRSGGSLDRSWVNWKVFLDRDAASDRGPGKPVELSTAWAAHSDRLD